MNDTHIVINNEKELADALINSMKMNPDRLFYIKGRDYLEYMALKSKKITSFKKWLHTKPNQSDLFFVNIRIVWQSLFPKNQTL